MSPARRSAVLLKWYDAHGRSLPWRGTRDPYRILVSEIMSQQTQLSRVIERYPRFLQRFPTVDDLAAATMGEVLKEWSGLGYNRRARNLHLSAIDVVDNGWPTTVEGLSGLPGIGPYTAAAVGSICFDRAAPAVDTNLRRVLGRWHGSPLSDAEARGYAEPLIDQERPGDWNQAVMDLGGQLCTPQDPMCDACPVARWCIDATVYRAPRPQGPFAGSRREARGAVVRLLIEGPLNLDQLAAASGLERPRIAAAARILIDEGLITADGDNFTLAS